jgi:D-alanyl-D-alanine carboxypeptidase-like protein
VTKLALRETIMGTMPVRLAVAMASATLCLIAAGCGSPGTRHPVTGAVPASSGSAPASPAAPQPSGAATSPPPASATPVPSSAPPASPGPVFQASTSALTEAMRTRMTGVSWHPGCPVSLGQLRLLRLSYWGFDHAVHQGELIVNASGAASLTQAFRQLFAARFPIRQMRVVDDFGGDDERSMLADNTSAFNCRLVPGTSVWAQHAYGTAVDINPFENPEIRDGKADPPAAAAWADRSRSSPAMIRHGDAVWLAFDSIGWAWGGDWRSLKDYQHFSANGL